MNIDDMITGNVSDDLIEGRASIGRINAKYPSREKMQEFRETMKRFFNNKQKEKEMKYYELKLTSELGNTSASIATSQTIGYGQVITIGTIEYTVTSAVEITPDHPKYSLYQQEVS